MSNAKFFVGDVVVVQRLDEETSLMGEIMDYYDMQDDDRYYVIADDNGEEREITEQRLRELNSQ